MKVTILMPTFNDAHFIASAIESILGQDYSYWELLIFDDASTDDTESVVLPFLKDKRIKYFKGLQNQDQLNALYQLTPYITGEIVTLLHSDDMFTDTEALSRIISYFRRDMNADGVYADLRLIDLAGNFKGYLRTPSVLDERVIARAFLAMGANIVNDFFCVRTDVFNNCVLRNYILWNMFYWLRFINDDLQILNLKKIDPWYNYRLGENYLLKASDVRRAFVVSGCYRTLVELSWYYSVYRSFFVLHRVPKVHRLMSYFPNFFAFRIKRSLEDFLAALERNSRLLSRLLSDHKISNPGLRQFFEAPIEYMQRIATNKQIVKINSSEIKRQPPLFGKDARSFFEKLLWFGSFDVPLYKFLIEGVGEIKAIHVDCQEVISPLRNILRFFCLPIPILVGSEKDTPNDIFKGFQRRFTWETT